MSIKSFPRPASAEQVLPALLEDGVVILVRTIPDVVMGRLMAEIEPHLADCPIAGRAGYAEGLACILHQFA